MSPATLETKIADIAPRYREELASFVDFLLFRQSSEKTVFPPVATKSRKSLFGAMKDENFYMAPDFDAPLEDRPLRQDACRASASRRAIHRHHGFIHPSIPG